MNVAASLREAFIPHSYGLTRESEVTRATVAAAPAEQERDARVGRSIALKNVTKAFGRRVVLDRIDLTIYSGEFVAIVGRSGGGKSSLLRLIAGLDRPTAGVVEIEQKPVTAIQSSVRLMFQDARLLPWQSVLGNVGIARGPNWRARAMQALESVGLADRADDWPQILSGGQRQRVALARALASQPSILLLDEPFGALDALTRAEMHHLLERLWRERRFTAVLITHDVGEAVSLADRALVLRDGAIALDAPISVPRAERVPSDPQIARLRAEILAAV